MIEFEKLLQKIPLPIVLIKDKNLVYANEEAKKTGIISLNLSSKDKITVGEKVYKLISTKFKDYDLFIAIEYTEEQRYLDALRVYERFFRSGKDFFFILDEKGRFIDVNQTYEVVGYHREELLGKTTRIIAFEDQLELLRNNFKKVMSGESVKFIFKAKTSKGEKKFIEVLEWPRIVDGKVIGAEGVARDITERYILQQELEKTLKGLRMLIEVNQQIFKERDEYILLQKVWNILRKYGIKSYLWIKKGDTFVGTVPTTVECQAIKNPELRYEVCNCNNAKDKSFIIPIMYKNRVLGLLALCSIGEINENEKNIFLELGEDLGLALEHYNTEFERRIMSNIISENLKHFENLADRLRNPLAIALGYIELVDEVGAEKVLKEIKAQLDRMMETIDELRYQETVTFLLTKRKELELGS
ncbi:MAG: PAS domain S-box protein [Archaeoglobaceae archaeon]|nr:PAS domain S-box protein [Archaeoglobaceae archaeon]